MIPTSTQPPFLPGPLTLPRPPLKTAEKIFDKLKYSFNLTELHGEEFFNLLDYMKDKTDYMKGPADFEILLRACLLYQKNENINEQEAEEKLVHCLQHWIASDKFQLDGVLEYPMFEGAKPLHLAAEKGCSFLCGALIKAGANVEELNRRNETPLQIAAAHGNLNCAANLVGLGAHPMGISKFDRRPIIKGACYPKIIQFFYEHRESCYPSHFSWALTEALENAVENSCYKSVKKILSLAPLIINKSSHYRSLRKIAAFNIMDRTRFHHEFSQVSPFDALYLKFRKADLGDQIACSKALYIQRLPKRVNPSAYIKTFIYPFYECVPSDFKKPSLSASLICDAKTIVNCINILSLLDHHQHGYEMKEISSFKAPKKKLTKFEISAEKEDLIQDSFRNLEAISNLMFFTLKDATNDAYKDVKCTKIVHHLTLEAESLLKLLTPFLPWPFD